MHFVLEIDPVHEQGGVRIPGALHWPVFFAVRDSALRYLSGDADTSDWLYTPGPLATGEPIRWRSEVPRNAVASSNHVGFGLMFTAGGADFASAHASYQQLVATIVSLVLEEVAHPHGLGAVLAGFGATRQAPHHSHARLHFDALQDGVDPQELYPKLDMGMVSGLSALHGVGQELAAFFPAGITTDVTAVQKANFAELAGDSAVRELQSFMDPLDWSSPSGVAQMLTKARGSRSERAGSGKSSGKAPHSQPVDAHIAEGTVIAVTLQAWNPKSLDARRSHDFHRHLRARVSLPVELKLTGRVRRED